MDQTSNAVDQLAEALERAQNAELLTRHQQSMLELINVLSRTLAMSIGERLVAIRQVIAEGDTAMTDIIWGPDLIDQLPSGSVIVDHRNVAWQKSDSADGAWTMAGSKKHATVEFLFRYCPSFVVAWIPPEPSVANE
jgi:hypothetical protein